MGRHGKGKAEKIAKASKREGDEVTPRTKAVANELGVPKVAPSRTNGSSGNAEPFGDMPYYGLVLESTYLGNEPTASQGQVTSLARPSPSFAEAHNQMNNDGIRDVALRLLLENQRANGQVRQNRSVQWRHHTFPNGQGYEALIDPRSDGIGSSEASTISHPLASVLDASGINQRGLSHRDEILLRQLNEHRLLSAEREMQMRNLQGSSSTNAAKPYCLNALWPAQPILNVAPSSNRNVDPSPLGYRNEQLECSRATASMPSHLSHFDHSSAVVNSLPPRDASVLLANGDRSCHVAATSSYDLVPATPVNHELLKRAKYLVTLSQADMSTWRNTRRRFRDEDSNGGSKDDDDGDGWTASTPRARKKKAT